MRRRLSQRAKARQVAAAMAFPSILDKIAKDVVAEVFRDSPALGQMFISEPLWDPRLTRRPGESDRAFRARLRGNLVR